MTTQAEKKRYKPHPSTKVKREWLQLYYQQKATVKAIADDYGYPAHTVYRVLRKMKPEKDPRSDKGKPKQSPVVDIDFDKLTLEGESPETQLEMFIQEMMRAISKTRKINVNQGIIYVNQLTNALRRLRSVQFANLAKSLDVQIVESIIRRYEPEATELRVIEIFKEESARVKANKL